MNVLTVWNKTSTNFNANAFVRANGTDRQEVESEDSALRLMGRMIHSVEIDRAILETPKGRLTWEVHQQDEPKECGDHHQCDGFNCGCDECQHCQDCQWNDDNEDDCDCGGCPGNDDEEIDPRM